MTVKCKTFDSYIKELIYFPRRAPKWFSDKRLTQLEKKILQGYLLIRNNKNSQVIEELKDTPSIDIDFVKDHHHLILGICYNNIGNHGLGEKFLRLAIEGFEREDIHYHQFTALFNLLILLSNTSKIKEMEPVIKKMEEICPDVKLAQLRLIRCQFIYACDVSDEKVARKLIQKIEKLKSEFAESDLTQHLLCEFMFHIKYEDFNSAEKVLDEMKGFRNYTSSDNYFFMKKLLSHLKDDSPLYVYERDLTSISFLYYQMKVIESLQCQNREEAKKFWAKLQEGSPHLYQGDFKYNGEKCLFSLCLHKHLTAQPVLSIVIDKTDKPLHQIVFEILSQWQKPIPKGHLFELVYGEPPRDKADDTKLSKLIYKVRSIYEVEIDFKKGTYFMEKSAPAKKASSF